MFWRYAILYAQCWSYAEWRIETKFRRIVTHIGQSLCTNCWVRCRVLLLCWISFGDWPPPIAKRCSELVCRMRGRIYSQVGEVRLWPVSRPGRGWQEGREGGRETAARVGRGACQGRSGIGGRPAARTLASLGALPTCGHLLAWGHVTHSDSAPSAVVNRSTQDRRYKGRACVRAAWCSGQGVWLMGAWVVNGGLCVWFLRRPSAFCVFEYFNRLQAFFGVSLHFWTFYLRSFLTCYDVNNLL